MTMVYHVHAHIYMIMLKHALCIHIMVDADEVQKQGVTWRVGDPGAVGRRPFQRFEKSRSEFFLKGVSECERHCRISSLVYPSCC